MKRMSTVGLNEPAQKRPPTLLEDKGVASEVNKKKKKEEEKLAAGGGMER